MTGRSVQRLVHEHHDVGPWNITFGAEYWFLLDFGNFTQGCPEYDLASFVVALGLYWRHPTVDGRLVADLQVRFIDSFRRSVSRHHGLDEELFRAFALMHLFEAAKVCLRPNNKVPVPFILRRASHGFFIKAFDAPSRRAS